MPRWLPWCFLAVVAAGPALLASDYHLFQLTMVAVYAVAVLGLAVVTGYNGQISLGHGAFFAAGAYTTAILIDRWDVPYWATLPVSGLLCAATGFLVGFPALRLGGLYLALTTFAMAVTMPQLIKFHLFEGWTGGVQGIAFAKPGAPFGLPLDPDQWIYLFTLAVGSVLFALCANLLRGRIGRAMVAIRDQPLAAEAMGIDIALFKTRTFAVSAAVTGVAGSLSAVAVQFVAPDSFAVTLSITLFVGLVVGGSRSVAGPVFGALFIEFVPNLASQFSDAAPGALYGLILIASLLLMPGGLAGFFNGLFARLAARLAARMTARPAAIPAPGADAESCDPLVQRRGA